MQVKKIKIKNYKKLIINIKIKTDKNVKVKKL